MDSAASAPYTRAMQAGATVDRREVALVCRDVGLELLILFGSQATGRTHPGSDADVGFVRRKSALAPEEYAELQARLAPLLPRRELDLVDLGRGPGLLRHLACERGVVLHEAAPGLFEVFRVLAWNVYQDERIQIRRHDPEAIREALRGLSR